ncbi:chorismate pyruvate-lyase family protein [Agarilytica rhodophyticola]|uniref:chorismate pyruvate-lyase family protein n=1 Tax=Agarilytica rhodophyticola TaxID=1737490 RepID=UPI000B349FCF|nr:chorismate pyruvate-lyase family protein [Agarilytica rhodophyticola]
MQKKLSKKLDQVPIRVPASNILQKYLKLDGSTTYFLQALSSKEVRVEVLQQVINIKGQNRKTLKRTSILYFEETKNILVVAKSSIFLENFTKQQQQKLIEKSEGIGKILDPNNIGLIKKQDISTSYIEAPKTIKTNDKTAICRRFILLYKEKPCAEISEIVNNESLARAL